MNLSKNLVVVLSLSLFATACGNGGDAKSGGTTELGNIRNVPDTPNIRCGNAASDKALQLIGASDCTTCHRLDKAAEGAAIGPAYSEVAAKYSPAADTTIARLVKKIISGGSGIWGTVPMTPHPALNEGDVKTMVQYIMTLKK